VEKLLHLQQAVCRVRLSSSSNLLLWLLLVLPLVGARLLQGQRHGGWRHRCCTCRHRW
jgi:hypothetical protein